MHGDRDSVSSPYMSTRTREKRHVRRNDESLWCCVGCDYLYMIADVVCHVGRCAPLANHRARGISKMNLETVAI